MEKPLAIANYFIRKSLNDGTELTPMKLVKLTYIAHGWYLALKDGEPLLTEAVQAWKYGPVVPDVYHTFKKYEDSRITAMEYRFGSLPIVTDVEVTVFLDKIWDVYKGYSGLQLSTLTHQPNTPWDIVWNKENGKANRSALIRNELIKEHYQHKMAEQQQPA